MAILVACHRFHSMAEADSRCLHCGTYVRMQHFVRRTTYYVPLFRLFFLGGGRGVGWVFMQRLSDALHGNLGSYLRDALQEGSADAVACLPVPRPCRFFPRVFFLLGGLRCFFLCIRNVLSQKEAPYCFVINAVGLYT
jgi:hypothetical protein